MNRRVSAWLTVFQVVVLIAWVVLLIIAGAWARTQPPEALETPPVACHMAGGVLYIDPAGLMTCETWTK